VVASQVDVESLGEFDLADSECRQLVIGWWL
jgi:hypothetical protein